MPMARREKEPILMARERANPHDLEKQREREQISTIKGGRERQSMAMTRRERETVDGYDQERERQSMAMTRRERDSGWP